MQLAGGRVSAQSAGVGQGATFVLAWPAADAHRDGASDPTANAQPVAGQAARREQS
jgi:hypothetical protein